MPKIAHRFIFDDLRRLIENGQMGKEEEFLPAENTLAARYNVSRPTIRKVLQMLAEDGLLTCKAGIGWQLIKRSAVQDVFSAIPNQKRIRIGVDKESDPWGFFYYDLILDGIKRGAEECNCELVLLKGKTGKWPENPDGVILSKITPDLYETYAPVVEKGMPVVILNRTPKNKRFFYFTVNHMEEAKRAVEYLLLVGHRKIAVLGNENSEATRERLNGWYLAFASNGLTPPEDLMLEESSIAEQEAFLLKHRPSAVFILEGSLLGRFLMATERAKVRIPEDLSILCFDGICKQPFLDTPISHVRMPLEKMGYQAVRAIVDAIRTPRKSASKANRETLEAELVITSSCRNINKRKIIS